MSVPTESAAFSVISVRNHLSLSIILVGHLNEESNFVFLFLLHIVTRGGRWKDIRDYYAIDVDW